MTKNWIGKRIVIREGWYEAGRQGIALGEPVFTEQDWVPVKMDDEEDPTFHKEAGLAFAPDEPVDPYVDIREVRSGKRVESGDPRNTIDRLLLDADTLLILLREPILLRALSYATAEQVEEQLEAQGYEVTIYVPDDTIARWNVKALAILPEHLK
ncbi:hypothetical protein LCGC14_2903510 [marine sediment metagenome]|uniref:Uncharacterized protein n=1 Tax=marine sediment metagenome TaxID=412755 RepID=A0A0F9A1I3_9ZZZZ